MQSMPRPPYPYLAKERGKWFVRKRPAKRVWIEDRYGTPEFWQAYQAALAGSPKAVKGKPGTGSLEWLMQRYRDSAPWAALSVATRRQRENIMKAVIGTAGSKPYKAITKAVIVAGVDRRKDTPAAARHFVETMRGLFRWAVEAGFMDDDPTRDVRVKAKRTEGHHTWTEAEMARYEARWPIGTRQRVAYAILLYTGLRRGDAVRFGRQHIRNGVARIVTEKTGELAIFAIDPELQTVLDAGPCGDLTFIAGEKGANMAKESFGTIFRHWCNDAGVPGSAHGLRKALAVIRAERGLSEHEMMPGFGWSDTKTAAIYTRKASRERLAESAMAKLRKNVE